MKPINTEETSIDEEECVINIAESSKFKHQDDKYNEAYKNWRLNKENTYAYNFVNDTREHTYINGMGFVSRTPACEEKISLSKNINIIGMILIATMLFNNFGQLLIVKLYSLFCTNISYDFMSLTANTPNDYKTVLSYFVEMISYFIPICLFAYFLKVPSIVMFPMKIENKEIHRASIPFLFIVIVVINYFLFYYQKVVGYIGIEMTSINFFIPENTYLKSFSFVLNVIIVPVLSELLLRGAIMQSLRQFGDGFALLITSIISCVLYHDWTKIFYTFILAIVIGYFVLRTGSLLTGIIMHIASIMTMYSKYFITTENSIEKSSFIGAFVQFILAIISFILILGFFKKKTDLLALNLQKTYLTLKEKLITSILSLPIIFWLVCEFVLSLITIKFKE